MTQFEFQESDVMFCDDDKKSSFEDDERSGLRPCVLSNKKRSESESNSPPVDIPHNVLRLRDTEDNFDDGEMVPPHVIVGRRWTDGRVSCSVCFSHGRTLKGRNLSQVRNSILRRTGFLES